MALEASPPDEDQTILTDSLVAMTTLRGFSLVRRADFPLSLHRNACRQLITHVVQLLNRRYATSVVTRIVKIKSHCGEPLNLNEAADALASVAAEADDRQLSNELHLEPDSVHFYLDDCPMTWGIPVRTSLTKVAADRIAGELGRPRIKLDGTVQSVTLTTAWQLRQDQGRQVLGRTLRTLKTNSH